jgi:hypothetical protein
MTIRFSSMFKRWFGKPQGTIQTRKKTARKSFKPMLQILEDRLAPATVDLLASGTTLAFAASTTVQETITVTAPAANTLKIAITNIATPGDTISLGKGVTGSSLASDFVLSNNNTSLQINKVNSSGGPSPVDIFNLILPNGSSFSDTLNFGLNSTIGNANVTIGGPNSPAVPDTYDTVTLDPVSTPNNLFVSAKTISFQPGATVNASRLALTSVNSLTFPSTGVPYLGAVTMNAAPPTGQPFAGDTYITGPDWGAYGYAVGDQITINGATKVPTTPYAVAAIVGDNLYVTPALPPAALPSTGAQVNDANVTVACANFTPAIQGSYAGVDLTVTGPGSSISGAIQEPEVDASTQNGNITLQNVDSGAGAEAYFTAVGGAISSVTTKPAAGGSGYPASSTFDLEVTGGGGSGGLVQATTDSSGVVKAFAALPAQAGSGYSTTPPGVGATTTNPLALGKLDAGTGTIQLDANGSLVNGNPGGNNGINLIAGAVDLVETGPGSSIGVSFQPITTSIGALTATTNDGGVYIANSGPGLTINSIVADQGGQAPVVSNGQIVYNQTPSSSTPTFASGDEDVSISSTGAIVLNSVTATRDVTITSGAYIAEGNAQSPKIVAQKGDLIAKGTADYRGQVTFANPGTGAEAYFTAGGAGGAITSVTTTPAAGGSGYPASSTFPLQVTGGGGSGGVVLATTDSSGVVTLFAALPVSAGSGYSNAPTVPATTAGSDTLSLPAGSTWSSFGFASGESIFVSGALASADEGAFTIANVTGNVLTLTQSYALAPDTQPDVTVGNGMIGQATAAIALSDVPLFSASTANGGIYLVPGAGVASTAVDVYAGGMNGMTNNVSVMSQANFLTIENINATGNAAVAMNSGSLLEYSSASYPGYFGGGALVSIHAPTNNGSATGGDYSITRLAPAGTTWAADGFAPGDVINVSGVPGVDSTTNYIIASTDGNTLYLLSGETIKTYPQISVYAVTAVADVTGQNVSLTSPYNIGTASSPFVTNAASGLTVAATATSPSSAAIYVDNASPLTSIGVSTYDGSAKIQYGHNGTVYAGSLSFVGNVLSETGTAVVTLANTDYQDGSAGNVIISGRVYVSGISAGISAEGTVGAGQILPAANSNATIDGHGGTVILSAGSGIGNPGASIVVTDLATLDARTTTGGIYIQNKFLGNPIFQSPSPITLSASASHGNIYVQSAGDIDLNSESSGMAESVYTTGTVTLATNGAIVDENGSTVYASTLMLTAAGGIGTATSPLETSSPGALTVTAADGDGLFLDNNMAVTVNSATAGNGDLAISATQNLTLLGNVSSNKNVTLSATDGTLTTGGSVLISAQSLALTAEQIGAPNDVLQTSATTIDAAANYGGIYLSNDNSGVLTLSAAAVGPTLIGGGTNNIVIYSKGNIVLAPQTTKLTKLATTLPVAVLNPGGSLTLLPGVTLTANGKNATGWISSPTITSADAGHDTATYFDVWTGNYDINGASPYSDNFSSTNAGGLDITWTVQSGSFSVDTASQTATATGTAGINLATVTSFGINSVDESVEATIDGTLASGQTAGLVALFSSPNTYYYGAIAATSSSTYTASIYSVVGGTATLLVQKSYTGSVSNAVLEFSVAGSSLSLQLNGSLVASATSSSITTAGIVGMLASSGVSFTNFSCTPALQIENNTSEVIVMAPGRASSTNTLLELTASQLEAGGTFIGGTIEIEDLGANGQPGTLTVPGDLVLVATAGPITFQNTLDTIAAAGTITLEATDVADLGNLTTTGGNITISAGGNIGVGTVSAGNGIVSITSSSGAIFNSKNGSTTLSISAGLLALHSSSQNASSSQGASSAASAAQSASIQDQLNAAEAAATAEAAAAVAAADQTTAAAFKAALTSIQGAVVIDNLAYQAAVQTTNAQTKIVNADTDAVTAETDTATVLSGIAGVGGLVAAYLAVAAAGSADTEPVVLDIPGLNSIDLGIADAVNTAAAYLNLADAVLTVAASAAYLALIGTTVQLGTDQGVLANDQSAQDQAQAQWQAALDTQTAFAAAYNVAEQNYASALAISNQDEKASEKAQQAAAVAEANATAAAAAASLAAATTPPTLNVTGPVAISNAPGAAVVNWTNAIVSNSAVTEQSQGPLTLSGVTIQSASSVTLTAGSNVDIASGSSITAAATSPITITANTNDAASGATVTLDGTLSAQSVSIGVGPNAPGNETFTITPSATTPISVNGGSDSSGANTLNYNAAGLAATVSETVANNEVSYTITAAGVQPVTFTNIEILNITNAAGGGSLTLVGLSGQDNAMSLVGTGQGAGIATLNGLSILFSGMTSFSYQGGGAAGGNGDTITVTPFVTSRWNLAVTVAGGVGPAGTVGPAASLTYNSVDSLADTVTATGTHAGSIASQGQAIIQFSNIYDITTNASQSPGAQLTVNLPDGSGVDETELVSVGNGTAAFNFGQTVFGSVSLFRLNVDTADYAGLTFNGNTVGTNDISLQSITGAVALPIPVTLNYPDMHSVVNTGAATSVEATASGDAIVVQYSKLVVVTDLFGNVCGFPVTDTQLVFKDLGNNDTIKLNGNRFTNGIYVDGNASFSDVINYRDVSGAPVTVTPSTATVSQAGAGAGAVFFAGIQSVNLEAGGSAALTVNGSGAAAAFDFTPTGAGAGSFTVVGSGAAIATSPLFTYTGFGNGVTVEGAPSLDPALTVATMTGNLATVTGYSSVDESVSATMTLTTGQYAGLVTRYTGASPQQNMDLGFVVAGSNSYTAYIYSVVKGAPTLLCSQTYSGSVPVNSTLMFDTVGSSLILSLGGTIIGCATDTALATTAGSVGTWTSSGAVLSNFVAAPVNLQTASNPFSDNFTTGSADGSLSTYWINQTGAFQVNTSSGTATAMAAAPVNNLATVNGISNANEAVSATINTLTTGQEVGLVARYSGSGLANMYYGAIVAGSGSYTAYIYSYVNGAPTTLFSQTYTGTATGAVLKFAVSGTSLTLTLNGTTVATATDSTLTSAGSVGIMSSGGATISSFSATGL